MPPGTGDVALTLAEVMPKAEIIVVTTPQPAAQRVAQRSAFAARRLKLSVRGVVENMSWFTGDDGKRYELFGSGGGEALAHDLGVPLLGQRAPGQRGSAGRRRGSPGHGGRPSERDGAGLPRRSPGSSPRSDRPGSTAGSSACASSVRTEPAHPPLLVRHVVGRRPGGARPGRGRHASPRTWRRRRRAATHPAWPTRPRSTPRPRWR